MQKERLGAFADAILAIIMTILVLELKKPEQATLKALWDLKINFFAYMLSFFWLGTMWINLHNEWEYVNRISLSTVWFTILLLFFSSLFPYATSFVSTHFYSSVAQGFYGIIILLITFSNTLMYNSLVKIPENDKMKDRMNSRYKWLKKDIIIKIACFIITVTLYTPMTMIGLSVVMIFLVLPAQFKSMKN